jgi:hypothetical protein
MAEARSNFSGGIDGRPVLAYIALNRSDMFLDAASAIALLQRYGLQTDFMPYPWNIL